LNFKEIPYEKYNEKHQEYIKKGENEKENKGYKCKIRNRWYNIPSIWVPDAFFLRRSNLYPKFVLNKCSAVSTDTMHRMKFKDDIDPELILLSYYNSISFAFTEICGRSYGGGVLEILPKEMGSIILPKIAKIDIDLKKSLLSVIDQVVRSGSNIESVLDIVDQEILVNLLGIEIELCQKCRMIWKKLRKRRLSRGL
jgi:adenine-specific DNA-methyltransferase